MNPDANNPDPHALAIARAVQEAVSPDIVILFGSRAAGDYRDDSDIDLLLITQETAPCKTRPSAHVAAREYMNAHPPHLEVNIKNMTHTEFASNRQAKQHIAGQAEHHGVTMSGENPEYPYYRDSEYPAHWPATKKRLENAAEWSYHFNQMVDDDHWNQKVMGFSAQQAIENALKGWLSAINDPSRFGHDLNAMWAYLERMQDWSQPGLERLRESVTDLFAYTQYDLPNTPGVKGNWLADYADVYRYDANPRPMTRQEKLTLRLMVNDAIERLSERIYQISEASESDIFTEGKRPWE